MPYATNSSAQRSVSKISAAFAAPYCPDIASCGVQPEIDAKLVSVEADMLEPKLDASGALGSFAPGLSTEALVLRAGYGDIEAAFAGAHAIVALDLTIGRHSGVPLETRGALARFNAAADVLELYGAAKVPHRNGDA